MPLYDFECKECGKVFEEIGIPDENIVQCPECGGWATKIFTKIREQTRFPEGLWDIGDKEVYISSRAQLREEFKRHNDNPDHTKHSYPKYLDGYGGY